MKTILAVAIGGALGTVLRYLTNMGISANTNAAFPWGILTINVVGCFIMGGVMASFLNFWNPSSEIKAFLTIGVLGGFTTFSAFSADVLNLSTQGQHATMIAYVLASTLLSIAAVFAGYFMIWKLTV